VETLDGEIRLLIVELAREVLGYQCLRD
jgi:hypothetical protein